MGAALGFRFLKKKGFDGEKSVIQIDLEIYSFGPFSFVCCRFGLFGIEIDIYLRVKRGCHVCIVIGGIVSVDVAYILWAEYENIFIFKILILM